MKYAATTFPKNVGAIIRGIMMVFKVLSLVDYIAEAYTLMCKVHSAILITNFWSHYSDGELSWFFKILKSFLKIFVSGLAT